ncbi:hypothetical protein AB0L40_26390, partial [Patulibacter sp. NPDC049589]|uniref:hypothetical protein n=1 Tax=Patulibacter sp. NPDC049589 TaxID=3154731 RepID=UPI00341E6C35
MVGVAGAWVVVGVVAVVVGVVVVSLAASAAFASAARHREERAEDGDPVVDGLQQRAGRAVRPQAHHA